MYNDGVYYAVLRWLSIVFSQNSFCIKTNIFKPKLFPCIQTIHCWEVIESNHFLLDWMCYCCETGHVFWFVWQVVRHVSLPKVACMYTSRNTASRQTRTRSPTSVLWRVATKSTAVKTYSGHISPNTIQTRLLKVSGGLP